jgi:hypothetical protein
LEGPAEEDLGGVAVAVLGGDLFDDRVVHLAADDGAVGFDDDVVGAAVGGDGALLADGVQLLRMVAALEQNDIIGKLGRRTSTWLTEGISKPAALISSKWWVPLTCENGSVTARARGMTRTHKLETPMDLSLPSSRALMRAFHISRRRSLPRSGSWMR